MASILNITLLLEVLEVDLPVEVQLVLDFC
jgi:hypothetical protein